jgi:tricorn protease
MGTQTQGYYRFPTIHGKGIAFCAEDDLWQVSAAGGIARRLTANLGPVTHPLYSEDGDWLAFVGHEEGHSEVYLMSAIGGPAKRLTFLGSECSVVGWHEGRVVFASNAGQPFGSLFWLHTVDMEGSEIQRLPYGPARHVSWGAEGLVIGRNTGDPARWKRYRGGTAGEIWIDARGTGEFSRLIELPGNLADPMWIGERIYFLSDHGGIGNLFSCLPDGGDLEQHTDQRDFYARNASTDGRQIVYHAGADVFLFRPETGESSQVEIEYHSPQIQRSRRFVSPQRYLEGYAPSHDGSHLALVHRGKAFTMGNWEGPVLQLGAHNGVRRRLARWLPDGKRVVLVSDEGGEDHLEVHLLAQEDTSLGEPRSYSELDVGRPRWIKVSPCKDEILLTNHRQQLIWIDLATAELKVIEQSRHGPIAGFDWSPDGKWVAYSSAISRLVRIIKIYDAETGKVHPVTEPVLQDVDPVFDPEGKYLYFLSYRIFDPVLDQIQFDRGFPQAMRPYAITLRRDLASPFVPAPRGFEPTQDEKKAPRARTRPLVTELEEEQAEEPSPDEEPAADDAPLGPTDQDEPGPEEPGLGPPGSGIAIDWEGIEERVVPFPVSKGIYGQLSAIKGRIFYAVYPVEGTRGKPWLKREPPANACVKVYDLQKLQESYFCNHVTSYELSGDGTAMVCRVGNRLRVIPAKRDPSQPLSGDDRPSRQSGWVDLSRLSVSIDPVSEWRQMLREAWRLQRDYFWVEDMSGVDWAKVLRRYEPLVERLASRDEFSDLLWEMQGELGTSHAYEMGGDYRPSPQYKLGFLGADLAYDSEHDAYRLIRILKGDVWDEESGSPLKRPGVDLSEGMLLLAIGGQRLSREGPPSERLVNQAGQEVQLTVAEADGSAPRTVNIRAARAERPIRYRDWVEGNRRYVHEKTEGRVGYIHIPDMSADGYAEFHRYFLVEHDHEGLIVDVRFNGGGNVSSLLLQKLARQRLGYDVSRWFGAEPYPAESVRGPLVAVTNEYAGSDGDIFSHSFKLMSLGTLIGRRTWGGVIGIWPRNWLVDGTVTSQPEFSFWFKDVGWGVENYGTDPDIEVDITPQDYARGVDAQLDRAIDEILAEIERHPPLEPSMDTRPKLTLPGGET